MSIDYAAISSREIPDPAPLGARTLLLAARFLLRGGTWLSSQALRLYGRDLWIPLDIASCSMTWDAVNPESREAQAPRFLGGEVTWGDGTRQIVSREVTG
jgi:hypothetical protein